MILIPSPETVARDLPPGEAYRWWNAGSAAEVNAAVRDHQIWVVLALAQWLREVTFYIGLNAGRFDPIAAVMAEVPEPMAPRPSLRCEVCGHSFHWPDECTGRSRWSKGTIVDGVDLSGQDAGRCICDNPAPSFHEGIPAFAVFSHDGRALRGAKSEDYPLRSTCSRCLGEITCADGTADWWHTERKGRA